MVNFTYQTNVMVRHKGRNVAKGSGVIRVDDVKDMLRPEKEILESFTIEENLVPQGDPEHTRWKAQVGHTITEHDLREWSRRKEAEARWHFYRFGERRERHRTAATPTGTVYHEEVITIYNGNDSRVGEICRDAGSEDRWLMFDIMEHCRGSFDDVEAAKRALEADAALIYPPVRDLWVDHQPDVYSIY